MDLEQGHLVPCLPSHYCKKLSYSSAVWKKSWDGKKFLALRELFKYLYLVPSPPHTKKNYILDLLLSVMVWLGCSLETCNLCKYHSLTVTSANITHSQAHKVIQTVSYNHFPQHQGWRINQPRFPSPT